MKKLALSLIFLTATLGLSAWAGPIETVEVAFNRIVRVIQNGSHNEQIRTMCQMARDSVAISQVSRQVLGSYANRAPAAELAEFERLVPSIIVTDMQSVTKYFRSGFELRRELVPRGSRSKGVHMTLQVAVQNNSTLEMIVVVTEIGGRWMITNLETISYRRNLVLGKKEAYGKIMSAAQGSPVHFLINKIKADPDFIRCP